MAMIIDKSKNPNLSYRNFKYGLIFESTFRKQWEWLHANVEQGKWSWDLIVNEHGKHVSNTIWIGFTTREDYVRFMLTWKS